MDGRTAQKAEQKIGQLRKKEILQAVKTAAGTNCALSFPVPVRKAGHIPDAVFLYDMGTFSAVRARPFASALLEHGSGILLEYRNAYLDDFMDTKEYPLAQKIDYSVPFAKTAAEQGKLLERIDELYESIRELAWKNESEESEKRAAKEYGVCFYRAVPRDLLPFYEALSPEFFAWLQRRAAE